MDFITTRRLIGESLTRFLVGVSALLAGCTHPLPAAEYQAYLLDPAHGLTHTQQVNGITVTCTYRPVPLLVSQDLARVSVHSPAVRDSLIRTYAGKTYCALSLSRDGTEIENSLVTDPTAYQQALSYLNTGIAADTYLGTTANDSVPAIASMYVRQYGNTGQSTVLLVFDTRNLTPEKGCRLTFQGQRLGVGTLRFLFSAHDLAALPDVQLN
jgi:hypothetical protein